MCYCLLTKPLFHRAQAFNSFSPGLQQKHCAEPNQECCEHREVLLPLCNSQQEKKINEMSNCMNTECKLRHKTHQAHQHMDYQPSPAQLVVMAEPLGKHPAAGMGVLVVVGSSCYIDLVALEYVVQSLGHGLKKSETRYTARQELVGGMGLAAAQENGQHKLALNLQRTSSYLAETGETVAQGG